MNASASRVSILLVLVVLVLADALSSHNHALPRSQVHRRASTPVMAKKKAASAKKKASGGFGGKGGGFGAAAKASEKVKEVSPEQRQWLDFMAWVTTSGGVVDAVRLANCGGGLRGLKATRDLARGDEIIRIPRSIMLDVARAEACAVSGVWSDASEPLPGYVKIALAVLYEQRRGAESDLVPYLEMLPSVDEFAKDGGPAAMWTDGELALTECGKLVDAAKRRREQSYGDGHPVVETAALAARWSELGLPGAAPTADELSWAVTAVTSRAYGVGTPSAGGAPDSGLIPVVDMANHDGRYPQHTAKGLEEDGESFVVLATEPIKRNQQVCLTYGNLANFMLLPQFGFVLTELASPPDIGIVNCADLIATVNAADGGPKLLADLAADGLLMCDADGTPSSWQSSGMQLQAAVLKLTEAELLPPPPAEGLGEFSTPGSPGSGGEAAGASPPVRALGTYKGLLQETLKGYSTTTAEDRAALGLTDGGEAPAEPMPARTRLAIEFRLAQKSLLNQAVASVVKLGANGISDSANRLAFEILGARVYEQALAEPGAVQTPSGLIIEHVVDGEGAQPTLEDTVEVHYEGRNADGIVFDSSYARGDPTAFPVTAVIAGWTEGLQLMRVGGKARLTVPYTLGYGEKGNPPTIPAKATLIFTVELLAIK